MKRLISLLTITFCLNASAGETQCASALDQIAALYASIVERGYEADKAELLKKLGEFLRRQPLLPDHVRVLLYNYQMYERSQKEFEKK